MTFALCWCLLCGWLNNWRGNGLSKINPAGWSSTVQRIVISVTMALPAIVASPYHGAAIAVLLFWPGWAMGWGMYFDMTDTPNPEPEVRWIDYVTRKLKGAYRDFVAMSLRGLHFTVPTALVGMLITPLTLILAPFGLLMGPVYYYSRRWGGGTKAAEWAWGAILGAIMFDMGLLMGLA